MFWNYWNIIWIHKINPHLSISSLDQTPPEYLRLCWNTFPVAGGQAFELKKRHKQERYVDEPRAMEGKELQGLPGVLCASQRDGMGCSSYSPATYWSHRSISAPDFCITRQAKNDTTEGGTINEYLPYVQIILLASLKRRIPFGDDPSKFKRCDLKNNSKNIQMVMEAENCNGFIPKTKETFAGYQVQLFDKPIPAFSLTTCTLVISTCCQRNNPTAKDQVQAEQVTRQHRHSFQWPPCACIQARKMPQKLQNRSS